MTRSLQFRAVSTLFVAGLFLAPSLLQAQDAPPSPEDRYVAYDEAPYLLNSKHVLKTLHEQYPAELRETGISGSVVLWMFVDESGTVAKAQVYDGADQEAFNDAALVIARGMKFRPATRDEEPVGVWILQQLDFDTQ